MVTSYSQTNFYDNKTVDLEFNKLVTVITGFNGCGKTRLINSMYNMDKDRVKSFKLSLDDILEDDYDYSTLDGRYFEEQRGKQLEKMLNELAKVIDSDKHFEFIEPNMVIWRDDDVIPSNKLSTGEKTMLRLLYELSSDTFDYVYIDCIDQVLHIAAQEIVLDLITKLQPTAQVLYATHSPSAIMKWTDNVMFLPDHFVEP